MKIVKYAEIVVLACILSGFSQESFDNPDQLPLEASARQTESVSDQQQDAPAAAQLSSHVRPRLLIGRPNSYDYGDKSGETRWLAAAAEAGIRAKLLMVSSMYAMPMSRYAHHVTSFRDFLWRIPQANFLETAKKVGATHAVYMEFEPIAESRITLYLRILDTQNADDEVWTQVEFDAADMETAVNTCIEEIAAATGKQELAGGEFHQAPVCSEAAGAVQKVGEILLSENDNATEDGYRKLADKLLAASESASARFAAARLYAQGEAYNEAANAVKPLLSRFGSFAGVRLTYARYARMAGDTRSAQNQLNELAAQGNPLTPELLVEQALIAEATGEFDAAGEYLKTAGSMLGKSPEIALLEALVAMQTGDEAAADNYVQQAAALLDAEPGDMYCKLGKRLNRNGKYQTAIDAFRTCIEHNPHSTEAWRLLAQAQENAGIMEEAALSYVKVFEHDPSSDPRPLYNAGNLLEQKGDIGPVIPSFKTILDGGFHDSKVAYWTALHAFENGNCREVRKYVEPMDQTWREKDEVFTMLSECNRREGVVMSEKEMLGIDVAKRKRSIVLGIVSGALAAGGAAAGYWYEREIQEDYDHYVGSKDTKKVQQLHESLEKDVRMRNALYAAGIVGVTGFAVNLVFAF